MDYDPTSHHRRSLRLQGYDYSSGGAYFVTICTQGRACLFGDVMDGDMRLNGAGRRVLAEWDALPNRFPVVELDACVVMPNHVHGIVIVGTGQPPVGAPLVGAPIPMADAPGDRATTKMAATVIGATTRVRAIASQRFRAS